jgi:hypothetical protein
MLRFKNRRESLLEESLDGEEDIVKPNYDQKKLLPKI